VNEEVLANWGAVAPKTNKQTQDQKMKLMTLHFKKKIHGISRYGYEAQARCGAHKMYRWLYSSIYSGKDA
jgi:hypothetical protein